MKKGDRTHARGQSERQTHLHKEDWSLASLPPWLRIGPSAHLRHWRGRRRRWAREKIVLWGPWQLHGRAFPFASLYFREYLFFSFTNWLYKTTPPRLAEGVWLSQREPGKLSGHPPRGQGQGRRCTGEAAGCASSRPGALPPRSPGLNSWAARTGERTPSRQRLRHGHIPRRCKPPPPPPEPRSARTSLPGASPPAGSCLPAVTTGPPRGDRGFSARSVPLLPPLAAGGLPTRRSWGPDRSWAARLCGPRAARCQAGRAARPPRPECPGCGGHIPPPSPARLRGPPPSSWPSSCCESRGLFAFPGQACQALGEKTLMWSTSCDSAGNSSATRRRPPAARRGAAACNRTAAAASSTGGPARAACSKAKTRAAGALSGRNLPLLPPRLRLPPRPPPPSTHSMAPRCRSPRGCSKGRPGRAPNSQPGPSSTWSP